MTEVSPPVAPGYGSDLTVLVTCEKGRFFVKGMRNRPGGRLDSLRREQAINSSVRSVAPALLWAAEDEEWSVLGFEAVGGRASDFTPESPDLGPIVALLNRIGDLALPDVARPWTETRWDRFTADRTEAELLRGDALLYTDVNEHNLMIDGDRMWAVDWSWPTRGAAFIDPACLVVQLVASGHSPEAAESWAARCGAWERADPRAIDAFAAADTRLHWTRAFRQPGETWLKAMAEAAESWANYRGVTVL
ncbi:hypothetical protein RM780_24280 [Streptomyces sp. DSM 44917]|uniref:Protein kinase n=1 Tax=Streptomyces boetiae TaxID=3075541 RepID=A0ABU2LEW8_9ACTN|nr:hypothetical protein [Streptomyces sp. DSM 44917]MDT0310047.1 hypothetical protein [Streptomyces sp. DSM 44917]